MSHIKMQFTVLFFECALKLDVTNALFIKFRNFNFNILWYIRHQNAFSFMRAKMCWFI